MCTKRGRCPAKRGRGSFRSGKLVVSLLLGWLAVALVGGCSPTSDGPQYGGKLAYNRNLPDHDLDPIHVTSLADREIAEQIYEGLLQLDPRTLEPVPCLAEKWWVEDGGRTYVFTLRKGVRFQDNPCFPLGRGREVTIEDVRYSFERGIRAPRESFPWRELWVIDGAEEFRWGLTEHVRGIELRPPRTIAFHLKFPVYHFRYVVSTVPGYIVPREAVEYYGTLFGYNPVGTGPFRLLEWVQGKWLRLIRNDSYWGRDEEGNRLPFLDEIRVYRRVPAGAVVEHLELGVLDFVLEDEEAARTVAANPERYGYLRADSVVMMGSVLAVVNFDRDGPLRRQAALRRAFFATFRPIEAAVGVIFHLPLPAAIPGSLSHGDCPPFSTEWRVAPKSVRECDPVILQLPLGRDEGSFYEPAYRRLRSAGWRYGWAAMEDSCDVLYFSCQASYPDAANVFGYFYSRACPWGFASARFDSLYKQFLQQFDPEKRHELACELSRQLELEGACWPLFVELNCYVWRSSLVNLEWSINPLSVHFFKYVWRNREQE